MKARLNALSAVTGLAQWRLIVEAIDCFFHDLPDNDRELVDGLSERLMKAGSYRRPAVGRNMSGTMLDQAVSAAASVGQPRIDVIDQL